MLSRHWPLVGLLTIALYVTVYCSDDSTAQQPADAGIATVKASDLGSSVKIIGRLGTPMCQPVAIQGYWRWDGGTKASPYVFRVTTVAGKELEIPVDFNQVVVTLDSDRVSDDDSALGETWTCVAIELGQFRNVREKHWELFYPKDMARGSWLKYGEGPFVSELLLSKRSLERARGSKLP